MKSCVNCKDANYCYHHGGVPSNHVCNNWEPSIGYKAYLYDQRNNSGCNINITNCKKLTELKIGRKIDD